MEIKIIAVYKNNLACFNLPEGFEEAQEAHPTEGGYNMWDGPVEKPETNFIGFLSEDHWIKEVEDYDEILRNEELRPKI